MKKIIIVLLIATAFLSSSCEKLGLKKSKTEILLENEWIQIAYTVEPGLDIGNGNIVTDMWATIEECEKETTYTFQDDGWYVMYDVCYETKMMLKWNFSEEETKMYFHYFTYDIVEFEKDKFILTYEIPTDDITYTFTLIFETVSD